MTDYLLLMRNEGDPMEALSPEEMQHHMTAWTTWMRALAASGRLKDGRPLAPTGATVGATTVIDGPYAEAKDVVGGYLIVACESLAHAIETARECPVVALGSVVEVRETLPPAG